MKEENSRKGLVICIIAIVIIILIIASVAMRSNTNNQQGNDTYNNTSITNDNRQDLNEDGRIPMEPETEGEEIPSTSENLPPEVESN